MMNSWPLSLGCSDWLDKNTAEIAEILNFDVWWLFSIKDNLLFILSQDTPIFRYYWEKKLYSHDLSLFPLEQNVQLWSSMYINQDPDVLLESLHEKYKIKEGISVLYEQKTFRHVLCGLTTKDPFDFYSSLLNNTFILKEFPQYLSYKTEQLFVNNKKNALSLTKLLER